MTQKRNGTTTLFLLARLENSCSPIDYSHWAGLIFRIQAFTLVEVGSCLQMRIWKAKCFGQGVVRRKSPAAGQ